MKNTNQFIGITVMMLVCVVIGTRATGFAFFGFGGKSDPTRIAQVEGDVQIVSIDVQSHQYATIVVQKGLPVRFILRAAAANLNSCNNTIVIPKYKIRKTLHTGENVIEFLPEETGDIPYTCQMGMIRSKIRVVAEISKK